MAAALPGTGDWDADTCRKVAALKTQGRQCLQTKEGALARTSLMMQPHWTSGKFHHCGPQLGCFILAALVGSAAFRGFSREANSWGVLVRNGLTLCCAGDHGLTLCCAGDHRLRLCCAVFLENA